MDETEVPTATIIRDKSALDNYGDTSGEPQGTISIEHAERAKSFTKEAALIIKTFLEPFFELKKKGFVKPVAVILFGSAANLNRQPTDLDVLVVFDDEDYDYKIHGTEEGGWDEILSQAANNRRHDCMPAKKGSYSSGFKLEGDRVTSGHVIDYKIMTRRFYRYLYELSGEKNKRLIAAQMEPLRDLDPEKAAHSPKNLDLNWLQSALKTGAVLIWGENIKDNEGHLTVPKEDLDFLKLAE